MFSNIRQGDLVEVYGEKAKFLAYADSTGGNSVKLQNISGNWSLREDDVRNVLAHTTDSGDNAWLINLKERPVIEDWVQHLKKGKKIQAIKYLRMSCPSLGLKEAKYIMDALAKIGIDRAIQYGENAVNELTIKDFYALANDGEMWAAVNQLCKASPSMDRDFAERLVKTLKYVYTLFDMVHKAKTISKDVARLEKICALACNVMDANVHSAAQNALNSLLDDVDTYAGQYLMRIIRDIQNED